jgi:hypothetical protein
MNCFPKVNRKKLTIWCEECDLVFEDPNLANDHHEKKKHKNQKNRILSNAGLLPLTRISLAVFYL